MSTRLYIVEGLPCSGKSTTARHIAERTGGKFFDEGCGCHPADYEFDAFIPDGAGGFTEEERSMIRENGEAQPGGTLLPLNRVTGELFDKALKFKLYDYLDWETERPVMLRKWRNFVQQAGENDVYVFNCVLMQNPMCETMMRFGFPQEKSMAYIREICDIIAPLEPCVIYLKSKDIAGQVQAALPERGDGWLNAVTDYHCNGGYGRANGLSGFGGYISALEERQRRELEMLPQLPLRSVVIDDPRRDWSESYRRIDEVL